MCENCFASPPAQQAGEQDNLSRSLALLFRGSFHEDVVSVLVRSSVAGRDFHGARGARPGPPGVKAVVHEREASRSEWPAPTDERLCSHGGRLVDGCENVAQLESVASVNLFASQSLAESVDLGSTF